MKQKKIDSTMGDSGSEPISGTAAVAWYENHPTRAAGKSLSLLTIIFWVSEDGSLSKAVGRLEEAIPDHVRIKNLNQAVHGHMEGIVAEIIQSGSVRTEEGKVALA